MAFPDSFVEEVRQAADIVRLVSEHVSLKKMGTSWKGLCPFHQEKTPSFNVRTEPPLFHCFGCGEGGDVFKFVMLHERVAFPEAVEIVARRFGVAVPERSFDIGPDRKEREEMLGLLEAAAQHFTRNLWSGPGAKAREYLLGRGFEKETLERIRAGAAPDSWTDLLDTLKKKFPLPALLAAGLVLEKQGGGSHYDRFRNRAVFPIPNEGGKVVAFGARSFDGSEPKYLNSPETPVYQKSRTLYGLSWAKDAIRRQGHALLMEGYLDVARALEAGVTEAVATCGTALTQAHARLLRRFSERAIVNFDQDEAGQKATRKSLEILVREGFQVSVVELPAGHDPDSFLKAEGAEAYRRRLAEAPLSMEWLIRRSAAEHEVVSPHGKAEYLRALVPALGAIESAVERAAWIPRIVELGGLDERATRDEIRQALGGGRASPASAPPAVRPPAARRLAPAERWLLALIVKEAEGAPEAVAALAEEELAALASGSILRAARAVVARGVRLSAMELARELADPDDQRLVHGMAVAPIPTESATPEDCVLEIKRWHLEAKMAEIEKEIPRAKGTVQDALLAEHLALKQRIAGLSKPLAVSS
jgi:DNA primase